MQAVVTEGGTVLVKQTTARTVVTGAKQGVPGPAGTPGSDGAPGTPGAAGTNGTNGTNGAPGAAGTNGTNGTNGQGVPTGGSTDQVLSKINGTDYNTQWVTPKNIATDTVWAAKGNLIVATANDTAQVLTVGTNTYVLEADSSATTGVAWKGKQEVIQVAISDETTALTTGTAKLTFRMPFAMVLSEVRASLTTVSSSGLPTFNVKEAGVTIFSTNLTIDASEKTSTTAATPAVISDPNLADDAEITVDIVTAGTGATGAKITLIGRRA